MQPAVSPVIATGVAPAKTQSAYHW
jgi:hypothetical protein